MSLPSDITASTAAPSQYGPLIKLARRKLLERLSALRSGTLILSDALGSVTLGDGDTRLRVHVQVSDPAFYLAVATSGSVGAGASYGDGHWHCDDVTALIRLLVRNRHLVDGMETGSARLGAWLLKAWHAMRPNTRDGARRNIAAHYDLGNDFFRLFLSDDLMYSSAMWRQSDETLEQASTYKLDVICRKLRLAPGHRVVEIGSGWGGFAIHAARHYGCSVVTTTISREQFDEATRRITAAGLQDRVTVLLKDYRDLEGQFDRVVSIEMIEAIGAKYLNAYFGTINRLLHPDGMALIQAITLEDHRYDMAVREVDFIKRFIFPGSFIPSIAAMIQAKARVSDLALVHLEDFGPSYARTLAVWRQRFLARRRDVLQQGFDERFARLWEFYLAYCEGGFAERAIGVCHLLMAKPLARLCADTWNECVIAGSGTPCMSPDPASLVDADLAA